MGRGWLRERRKGGDYGGRTSEGHLKMSYDLHKNFDIFLSLTSYWRTNIT